MHFLGETDPFVRLFLVLPEGNFNVYGTIRQVEDLQFLDLVRKVAV